jgi:lipopolysaccharide transport system ATP-binding protein
VVRCSAVQEDGKELFRSDLKFTTMSDTVISVENLSKSYLVGHQAAQREGYIALRDVIAREVRNFSRKARDFVRGRPIVQGDEIEEFWALKDVSFDVKRGEVLGIIGRNGAGKSTLLKVLSRITEPTRGRVTMCGRVASLLEVGTGFHPELTGRENIFLNGAILGMTRAEIKKKFDEIVAFAEVARFLDTPVKRYSSGMYVRLAFSVAAHLEPEVLIVDEVLAVGDIEFQKKCLGKMRDVASTQGRTVLFVTHNMAAVESLCNAALLLAGGRCVARGRNQEVLREYLRDINKFSEIPITDRKDRSGSGDVRFRSLLFKSSDVEVSMFQSGLEASFDLEIENRTASNLRNVRIALGIDDEAGQRITILDTALIDTNINDLPPGRTNVRAVIPRLSLLPGRYQLTLFAANNGVTADWLKNVAVFDVEGGDYYGTGHLPPQGQGKFLLDYRFVECSVVPDLQIPEDIGEPC